MTLGLQDSPRSRPAREQKRERILDAAFQICERQGVEGARMEEVASLAGVSKGTLYNFFRNKHELFLATIIDSYEESLQLLDVRAEADSDADPRARLKRIFEGLTRILTANALRMSVHYQAWGIVAGVPASRERLHGFLREFFEARTCEIAETIRDGQASGVFARGADAAAVSDGIVALLSGFLYRSTFDPPYGDPARLRACLRATAGVALGVGPAGEEERRDG